MRIQFIYDSRFIMIFKFMSKGIFIWCIIGILFFMFIHYLFTEFGISQFVY